MGAGVVASVLLASLKVPLSYYLLELRGEVLAEASAYYNLRTVLVPVLLFNMSINGILQVGQALAQHGPHPSADPLAAIRNGQGTEKHTEIGACASWLPLFGVSVHAHGPAYYSSAWCLMVDHTTSPTHD